MANTVIGASVQVEYKSIGEMRNALKKANDELVKMTLQFGETSKQAIKAGQSVQSIRKQISDVTNASKLFEEGQTFKSLIGVGSQIASGFATLQSALSLVGVESENVQESLLKIQSSMALAQGLNDLKDFGDNFKKLNVGVKANNILMKANAAATALTSKAMKLFGGAVNTTATSFRVLKTVIVSTGIGALLLLIGEAIGALMDFADSTEEAAKADEELKKKEEKLEEAIRRKNEMLEKSIQLIDRNAEVSILSAKAAGASEKEIVELQRKALQDKIAMREKDLLNSSTSQDGYFDRLEKFQNATTELEKFNLNEQIKAREAANKKSEEANRKSLEKSKENAEKRKQLIEEATKAEKQANDELIKSKLDARGKELFDLEKTYKEQKAIIEKGGKDATALTEVYNRQRSEINKKYNDELKKKEQEFLQEINKINEEVRLAGIKNTREKEAEELKSSYNSQLKEIWKNENYNYYQKLALSVALIKKQKQEENALQERFRQEDLQKTSNNLLQDAQSQEFTLKERIAKVAEREKLESQIVFKSEEERTAFQKQNADERTKIAQAEAQNRIGITESFVNVLSSLDSITGKNSEKSFERSKRLQIAQALINTYLSINKTLAAFAGVPIPGYAIAQAIATGIAGFVQVKKIAETKYQSPKIDTTPGTAGGAGAQTTAPLTPGLGATATAQALNAEAINNLGNTALRAYVMNSDIQNNSQRNAYLQRNARIG